MWVCVCLCVWFALPIGTCLSLDQNLAWHMLPATAGMKEVGTTFIVGKISTGGRCTICNSFYQVDWRMTSRGPLVKKHFPFHTGNSVSNKRFRDRGN